MDTMDRTHITSALAAFIHTHNCQHTTLEWIPNLLLDCLYDAMRLDKQAVEYIGTFFSISNDVSTISSLVASVRAPTSMDPLEQIIGYHPRAPALLLAILQNTVCNNHTDTSSTILGTIRTFTLETSNGCWNAQTLIDELLHVRRMASALNLDISAKLWIEALYSPTNPLGSGGELSHTSTEAYRIWSHGCREHIRTGLPTTSHQNFEGLITILRTEAQRAPAVTSTGNKPTTAPSTHKSKGGGKGSGKGNTTPNTPAPPASTAAAEPEPSWIRPHKLNPGSNFMKGSKYGTMDTLPCINFLLCNPPVCKLVKDVCPYMHDLVRLTDIQRKFVVARTSASNCYLTINWKSFSNWKLAFTDLSESLQESNPTLSRTDTSALSLQQTPPPPIAVASIVAPTPPQPSLHSLNAPSPPNAPIEYPPHGELLELWLSSAPSDDDKTKYKAMTVQAQSKALRCWYKLGSP